MKPTYVVCLVVPFLFACSLSLSAACLDGYPTVKQEYARSKFVLIGKVVGHHKTPAERNEKGFFKGDTYRLAPVRVFKGKMSKPVEIFSENSTARFPMEVNRTYLVFLYADSGRLIVDNCGNSDLEARSGKAIEEIAGISK